MQAYSSRAKAAHSGFEMNPSPGNIEDGLTTDAIKSAGAARKGGVAPVRDVLDFPEYAKTPGLSLLCTPGNDVECVTAQAGAGANLVLFTTGLGTPTGNPVAPVIKISTNSPLADRMGDIIDFDAGGIVTRDTTIPECAGQLLELCLQVANGERLKTKAEQLGQYDFIPWKRDFTLANSANLGASGLYGFGPGPPMPGARKKAPAAVRSVLKGIDRIRGASRIRREDEVPGPAPTDAGSGDPTQILLQDIERGD